MSWDRNVVRKTLPMLPSSYAAARDAAGPVKEFTSEATTWAKTFRSGEEASIAVVTTDADDLPRDSVHVYVRFEKPEQRTGWMVRWTAVPDGSAIVQGWGPDVAMLLKLLTEFSRTLLGAELLWLFSEPEDVSLEERFAFQLAGVDDFLVTSGSVGYRTSTGQPLEGNALELFTSLYVNADRLSPSQCAETAFASMA